jgi:hypothetical protein
MSLTTNFIITTPTNPELVFLMARRFIGIPAEQPFTVQTDRVGDRLIFSEPDGFDAMLTVWHRDGDPVLLETGDPATYVRVCLDTSFSEPDCIGIHNRVTAELGAWCDSVGLPWWTADDGGAGWHEATPAYAAELAA